MKFDEICKEILEKVDLLGTKPKDYKKSLLKKGSAVEKEHTDSTKKATTIAMQHSAEFPKEDKKEDKIDSDYYDELDTMEQKLKKKITKSFKDVVKDIKETTMAGSGGVFGDSPEIGSHGGQVGNTDWYAPGDARNLFGAYNRKMGDKKKKVKKNKNVLMPVVKRSIYSGL